jgi:hypothetical protein
MGWQKRHQAPHLALSASNQHRDIGLFAPAKNSQGLVGDGPLVDDDVVGHSFRQ